MTSEEFYKEVISSDICPEDFEEKFRRFRKYQEIALNTLKEVHRLCESHGIRYQLAYGTLIGAIRDKGQVPWDYDIDIFIPYEDKDAMIRALKEDLDPNYYAWCPEIDQRCDHTLMRISPAGYNSDGIHVDVFYIMAVPDDEKACAELLEPIARLYHTRSVKMSRLIRDARGSKKRLWKLLKEKIDYLNISQKKAEAEYDRRCSLYRLSDTKHCAPATIDAEKCIYDTEPFLDTSLVELPAGTFRITKDYDHVLSIYYGDYMKIPPLEERIREMLINLNKIDYYGKKSGMFGEAVKRN